MGVCWGGGGGGGGGGAGLGVYNSRHYQCWGCTTADTINVFTPTIAVHMKPNGLTDKLARQ